MKRCEWKVAGENVSRILLVEVDKDRQVTYFQLVGNKWLLKWKFMEVDVGLAFAWH